MTCLAPLLVCFFVASSPLDDLETGFVPMFDGKLIDGWTQVGGIAKYRVGGDEGDRLVVHVNG